ncbi:hypothetical protein PMAYCL1PPCAC_21678, partial [Pristionchus mayeri]
QREVWFNMGVLTILCTALSFIVYCSCLIRLCFFSVARNSTIERNFLIVGISSLIFSLPYMSTMAYLYLVMVEVLPTDGEDRVDILFQLPWLTDLKYLSLAPMLLLTNSKIRKSIKKFL